MGKSFFYLIILINLTCYLFAGPAIPDSIEDIKISIETESQINQALHIIKKHDSKIFNELISLREKDPAQFKKRLKNYYYEWMHTQVLLKNLPKRKKGYRKKVKESEIELKDLFIKFNKVAETDKPEVKNLIQKAALKRYEIELAMQKFQVDQLKIILAKKEKDVMRYEKNKDLFIDRVVTKNTRKR